MQTPSQMKAIDGALTIVAVATPQPASHEVLIRVHASGVNRADVYQSRGEYPVPPGASPVLGLEVSGTIVALGGAVTGFTVGERVMALVSGGGYAEYCTAPAATTFPIPTNLGFVEAAAVPEAFFTVWLNLFDIGKLRAGETVLIQGGASGIGSAAIPIAKAFGATIITTAGSEAKCALCRELGANLVVNHRTEDFFEATRKFTDGVDVILDFIGAAYLERHLRLLKWGGRLLLIDSWTGAEGKTDLRRLVSRNLTLAGSVLRRRSLEEKARLAAAVRTELLPKLAAGAFVPRVSHRLPAAAAAEAHAVLVAGGHAGKIVLEWIP